MGSAKTALLLTTAYNFEERKMKYVCLKPVVDTRDLTNVIKSRIGIQRECQWIYHDTDLYEMKPSSLLRNRWISFQGLSMTSAAMLSVTD